MIQSSTFQKVEKVHSFAPEARLVFAAYKCRGRDRKNDIAVAVITVWKKDINDNAIRAFLTECAAYIQDIGPDIMGCWLPLSREMCESTLGILSEVKVTMNTLSLIHI